MEQSNQSKKVLLSVIGVAILVVAVVGVSFAFFNYTRTQANPNTITTGHIVINSTTSDFSMEDLFPISKSVAETASSTIAEQVVVGTVTITGKTTYNSGMDYRVTAQNVNLAALPISIYVEEPANVTGISNHHVYSYNTGTSSQILPDNALLASGHINYVDESADPISHTITIRAYIDGDKYAITDTSSENATWLRNRTVYTTSQWNALHEGATPASFKIRVEAEQTGGSYNYGATAATTNAATDYTYSAS